jgi:phosphatidylserine decarboxylase
MTTVIAALVGALLLAALAWKWCLPVRRSAWIIGVATLAGASASVLPPAAFGEWVRPLVLLLIQGTAFLAVVLFLFYRDPNRAIPMNPNVIVSPADGTVVYIRRLEAGRPITSDKNGVSIVFDELNGTDLTRQALWQIGISMVFTDVHVNRSPIAGTVALVHHRPGRFLSLRDERAVGVNERQTFVIVSGSYQIGLVQIASRLVRQIVAYVSPGEMLALGQRIGVIRFGSQVDLFVPVAMLPHLNLSVGQRMVAGETIVGRIES